MLRVHFSPRASSLAFHQPHERALPGPSGILRAELALPAESNRQIQSFQTVFGRAGVIAYRPVTTSSLTKCPPAGSFPSPIA